MFDNLLFQEQFKYLKTTHSYHLVDPSPWTIKDTFGAFMLTMGGVLYILYMHKFIGGWSLFITGFCVIAILFIIFDIEIMFWSTIDFLFELNIEFFYVWYVGASDWE